MAYQLENISFENNNHSIIYAPNATGKTRLTINLSKKHKDDSLFFTASKIDNIVKQSGKNINVGFETPYKNENESIEKEYNKIKNDVTMGNLYGSNTAKELAAKSFIFSKIDLKNKATFTIYDSLKKYLNSILDKHYENITKEDSLIVDKTIPFSLVERINRYMSEKIQFVIDDSANEISPELYNQLIMIKEQIESSISICPLCGYSYGTNNELIKHIKERLKMYHISNDNKVREDYILFRNALINVNKETKKELFIVGDSENDFENLLININKIDSYIIPNVKYIIKLIDEKIDSEKYEKIIKNEKIIELERKKRISQSSFLEKVVENVKELITLPNGYSFVSNGDSLQIIDENNKSFYLKDFLSDSEIRRFGIAVAKSEIIERSAKYVVFDDAVDSNDDYYFDITVNTIIDLLFSNLSLNWIVLTHEFRMSYLFYVRWNHITELIKYNQTTLELPANLSFLFCLPDPSWKSEKKPPITLHNIPPEHLACLNEYEVIIFSNIFTGKSSYKCDPLFALLASFNQARCLYEEVLDKHKILTKFSKRTSNKIKYICSTYEHFVFSLRKANIIDLFLMNKMVYAKTEWKKIFEIKKYNCAVLKRKEFLENVNYDSLVCSNELIKYILFTLIRVMNSHYNFEKTLGEWSQKNIILFNCNKFESIHSVGHKLAYVRTFYSSCNKNLKNKIDEFTSFFDKWRGLLNDFSHGATRMFPPYLSVSPHEITKLENGILNLSK